MKDTGCREYFRERLVEAEKELAGFENSVSKYELRVWHRDIHGEREMTDQTRWRLREIIEEYRRLLHDD